MKIPLERLCRAAGIGRTTYYAALDGRAANDSTIAKLNRALDRFRSKFGREAGELAPHATFKACIIVASLYLKADARAVMGADPSRKATADPEWMKSATVRRLAVWMCNGFFGMAGADIARAAGVTRQAVSDAITAIEDAQETNAEIARICSEIERVFE